MSEQEDSCVGTINAGCKSSVCENIKLVLGSAVVLTLVFVVIVCVASGYSILPAPVPVNFVLMVCCLTWLAYVEALHYSVIAVEKWDMAQYKDKYPRAVCCHSLVDTPTKVKKFIVGRQFFVIFVVFILAEITAFPGIPKNFAGLPYVVVLILLQTGLPGIAITLTFGQLVSQLYVEEFTLQCLQFPGNYFVISVCLGAEWVGVCHFSWLLYASVARLACGKVRKAQKQIDRERGMELKTSTGDDAQMLEDPSSPTERIRGADYDSGMKNNEESNWFDYPRYVWSTVATMFSIVVVIYGISIKAYVLPVPPVAAYLIAVCMLTVLFYLEGLMIAIVGTQYWDPEQWKDTYPRAYVMHKFVNQPENVKRFIIGRQFFTVLTNFLLAQVFVFKGWECGNYNKIMFFILIKSGLVGVLIILSFGQLLPELLAAQYPLRFMNLPGALSVIYLSQFFDMCGVGHCAWAAYYMTRGFACASAIEELEAQGGSLASNKAREDKPQLLQVRSAEIMAANEQK